MASNSEKREAAREAACGLLRGWGIDPDNVARRDVTEWGYLEFVLDENGRRIVLPDDSMKVIARDWPSDFPVDVFFGFVHEMNGAVL